MSSLAVSPAARCCCIRSSARRLALLTLLANIPLFVIGFRSLGGLVFGIRTLYATVLMSLAIDLLMPYARPITGDPLLYTLYGGLLDGLGVGLVFRARGTTGGIDIIARLIEQRTGVQPGRSMLGHESPGLLGSILRLWPRKGALRAINGICWQPGAGLHIRGRHGRAPGTDRHQPSPTRSHRRCCMS